MNHFIAQHGTEITALLQSYGVPLVEPQLSSATGEHR
jgi:mxaJ protein